MNNSFLPFALPYIGQEEIDEVVDTLRSGWLTSGKKTKEFENRLMEFLGADHAIAVNSATAGLHLALEAVGIGPGDKVITTPFTFTATAEVIRYLGADPVFVDIDGDSLNIDVESVSRIAGQVSAKAIMPVHFGGQCCDMDPILELASTHGWKVVEDAAHAFPSTYKGRLVGGIGDMTVFSFYVTKTIATGEGGMITTNSSGYADRMKIMRLHGISSDVFDRYSSEKPKWYYEVVAPGFKYNLTDIASSLGLHQLGRAWDFQKRREVIANRYFDAFGDLPMKLPYPIISDDIHSWHLFAIQLNLDAIKITRNQFIELMSEEGIGTSVHFIPLHIHPYWKNQYNFNPEDFPVTLDVYNRIVSLPIYPKMSDEDVDSVIEAVRNILLGVLR